MISYRLYTENKNRIELVTIVEKAFPLIGATFYTTTGVWQGVTESSLVIEIITENAEAETVNELAKFIKQFNKQENVLLVTAVEVQATLI